MASQIQNSYLKAFLNMKNKDLSVQDIIEIRRGEFNPNTILKNAHENKITIYKPDNYKIKKEGYKDILRYKNATILSTTPAPNSILGDLLVFFPKIDNLLLFFSMMRSKAITQQLLRIVNIKYLSPEKFPCSFFIGHMPELNVWHNFKEESFLGYPERELHLNLYCSQKKFKFHTKEITE